MQAIQIRFLGATNHHGARIKAFCAAGSVTVPFQYEISDDVARAQDVAQELIYKLGWKVEIKGIGVIKNGDYVAVLG